MRIEQLEYIAAVTQHGSLRKASERLHVSQPALSEAVARLGASSASPSWTDAGPGARISRRGREPLQNMVEVLEAVDRLRTAAGDQAAGHHVVRVGTVSTATSTVLVPAVLRLPGRPPRQHGRGAQHPAGRDRPGAAGGQLDLGLVNVLAGDDAPPDLVNTALVHGRPVAVLPAGHPLASYDEITTDQPRAEPFVAMRAGYLMHRFAHRLFGSAMPEISYTTDGAELGKIMVAEGLGPTVLPHYSVVGDPLERAGLITHRPLRHDATSVTLVLRAASPAARPADRARPDQRPRRPRPLPGRNHPGTGRVHRS